jgi:hypothetical protein
MVVAKIVNIHFDKGVFRINAEIPVAGVGEAIESLIEELKSQLLGETESGKSGLLKITPKELNEKDAAKYIGRSISFLRTCRYKEKTGEMGSGPKYIRDLNKFIHYSVKDLDEWLNGRQRFRTCFEEKNSQIPERKSLTPFSQTNAR